MIHRMAETESFHYPLSQEEEGVDGAQSFNAQEVAVLA